MNKTTLSPARIKQAIGYVLALAIVVLVAVSVRADLPVRELLPKYTTDISRFARIDGIDVHYRDEGRGPALLLVHGSNCSLHSWEGWQTQLKAKFRVISVDLPGHGLTGPDPEGRYDYAAMVRFLDRLADHLHIDKFSLAGNSMGGAIAIEYALMRPARMEKLILIDSLGYPEQVPPLILRMWGYPVIGQVLTVLTPRFAYAQTIRGIYGHKERVSDPLIDRYYELLLREGNRAATRTRFVDAVWSVDVSRLRSIGIPTLVMWGGKDPWFDAAFGKRFAQDIPGAAVRIYPDLGHVPMEEAPEITARDAASFLMTKRSTEPDY
jgi:pimeloyl-ACP methyl ester carboxylesterase